METTKVKQQRTYTLTHLECDRCFELKPHADFAKRSACKRTGLQNACKDCNKRFNDSHNYATNRNKAYSGARKKCGHDRRTAVKQATTWQARQQWQQLEELRLQLQAVTGRKHVLDHVVPLKGRLVCGLNVPGNINVIDWELNAQKSNKFNPYSVDSDGDITVYYGITSKDFS